MRPATIPPQSAERDLCGGLLTIEDDIRAVQDCLAALRLMTVNPVGDFGPVHIGAIYRIADLELDRADTVSEQRRRALELAKERRPSMPQGPKQSC
jgi:hypothetical protein